MVAVEVSPSSFLSRAHMGPSNLSSEHMINLKKNVGIPLGYLVIASQDHQLPNSHPPRYLAFASHVEVGLFFFAIP